MRAVVVIGNLFGFVLWNGKIFVTLLPEWLLCRPGEEVSKEHQKGTRCDSLTVPAAVIPAHRRS